jgi:hypothetical protein
LPFLRDAKVNDAVMFRPVAWWLDVCGRFYGLERSPKTSTRLGRIDYYQVCVRL